MLRDTATKHHASNASQPPLDSTPTQPSSNGFFFSSARCVDVAVNKSASAMGQAESTARPPEPNAGVQAQASMPPPPSPQPKSKSRFGWPGRRKKSEDLTRLATPPPMPSPVPSLSSAPPSLNNTSRGRELARQDSNVSSVENHSGSNMHELSRPPSRSSSAKQLTLQFASNTLSALKGKLNASQASIHSFRGGPMSPASPPPPLPPKPDLSRLSTSSSRSESSSGEWVSMEKTTKPLPSGTPDASVLVTGVETRHSESVPTATTTVTTTSSSSAERAHDVNVPQRRERERREGADAQTAKEIADDWRKSDSTLRTVRLVGSRTPRPLSLAESTNSNHTVLPTVGAGSPAGNLNMGAGKRLSALMTDADFGLKEVDSEEDDDDESAFPSAPPSAFNSVHSLQEHQALPFSSSEPTPTSSKPQPTRRGSLSIRIGRFSGSKTRVSEHGQLDGSDSEVLSSSLSTQGTGMDMGMLTANSSSTSVTSSSPGIGAKDSRPSIEIASSASIASSMSSEHNPDKYAQYKSNSKLEPWISLPPAATESQASLSTSESTSASSRTGSPGRHTDRERSGKHAAPMSPPHGVNLRPAHQRNRLQSIQARGFRQTAVSLTTGLAPAAGFAKKAVDRLGRALAGSSTSLSNTETEEVPVPHGSGHKHGHAASASASNAALFGQQAHGHHQRHHMPQHPPSSSKKAMRKHGASSSGTWSMNSTSTSDTDGGPSGPYLGPCLRGSLIPVSNNNIGLVFGRELELCVKDTACTGAIENSVDGLSLEGRSLPALVVRCAQHIVRWGVQEEGLFRISGRSTHISKLRAEFDSGADYDLRECGPGEIDPHAVSSIFKAYLRELPEPLLTRHLMPYFEAALTTENNMINATDAQAGVNGGHSQNGTAQKRVSGLPSSPRDSAQVRKAPSLSTFAVPALMPRTASHTLLAALSALIARLPKENRDLLRTVTELIMATARASKETKMPLSNLLLVFCPSLMMGPPLLRVLCEAKDIWDGPMEDVKSPPVPGEPSSAEASAHQSASAEEKVEAENEGTRTSEDGDTGLHHQRTIRRPPLASSETASTKAASEEETVETGETATAPPLPSLVLPSNDGETSVTSKDAKTDSSISTSINLSSPDGNITQSSNSSDSLHTPPSSSPGSVSPNDCLAPTGTITKPALDTTGLTNKIMALHAQSDFPSPLSPSAVKRAVRKSLIGNPVPFPLGMNRTCSGSAPVTPIELGGSDKLSLTSYSSSSPNLAKDGPSPSPASTPPRLGRRKSKASLLGLKSKRSLSSLLGLAQEQAQSRPLRPAVPDLTEKVDKESNQPPRSSTPCPVLNLLDTSRIRLGEGFGLGVLLTEEPEAAKSERMTDAPSTLAVPSYSRSSSPSPSHLRPQDASSSSAIVMDRAESTSSVVTSNSVFYTPPTTTRGLAPSASSSITPTASTSSSNSGSYSFLDFNLGKGGEDDDWANSVLRAASHDV